MTPRNAQRRNGRCRPSRISTADSGGAAGERETVSVVLEAPLTIDVQGVESYTLLCTPGDDRALAAGFLLSEGIIDGARRGRPALEECEDDPVGRPGAAEGDRPADRRRRAATCSSSPPAACAARRASTRDCAPCHRSATPCASRPPILRVVGERPAAASAAVRGLRRHPRRRHLRRRRRVDRRAPRTPAATTPWTRRSAGACSPGGRRRAAARCSPGASAWRWSASAPGRASS